MDEPEGCESWLFDETDHRFMAEALAEARAAAARGEVPVGAVLVRNGEIVARAGNRRQELHDVTAHAELLVLRQGGAMLGDWRLEGCTLYVTLEPCPICTAACRQARLELVVWAAADSRLGACGSVIDLAEDARLGPTLAQRGGLGASAARDLLRSFFAKRRETS